MNGVVIDSCVLLDLFTDDPNRAEWSESVLEKYSLTNTLYINSIVYTELSIVFQKIEEVEDAIDALSLKVLEMPREALFLTGKIFLKYRACSTCSIALPNLGSFLGLVGSIVFFLPATQKVLSFLQSHFGHRDFGVLAEVVSGGSIQVGNSVLSTR